MQYICCFLMYATYWLFSKTKVYWWISNKCSYYSMIAIWLLCYDYGIARVLLNDYYIFTICLLYYNYIITIWWLYDYYIITVWLQYYTILCDIMFCHIISYDIKHYISTAQHNTAQHSTRRNTPKENSATHDNEYNNEPTKGCNT